MLAAGDMDENTHKPRKPPGQLARRKSWLRGRLQTVSVELTHVLAANLRAALLEALLDIFLLIALVVPEPPDEVVQRLFEPAHPSAPDHGRAVVPPSKAPYMMPADAPRGADRYEIAVWTEERGGGEEKRAFVSVCRGSVAARWVGACCIFGALNGGVRRRRDETARW